MSAAACWEDSQPGLPPEIAEVLESAGDPALADLELLAAMPEWEVDLPGGENASQTDVLALARNKHGLVVIGVEAKVEEPFGPTLEEKKAGATEGQLLRIAYLERELGRTAEFEKHIRYQLLHRTVSALHSARAFHAPIAVMLVQSFSPTAKWRDDFERFCQALGCRRLSPNLWEVPSAERRLLLGWCKGREIPQCSAAERFLRRSSRMAHHVTGQRYGSPVTARCGQNNCPLSAISGPSFTGSATNWAYLHVRRTSESLEMFVDLLPELLVAYCRPVTSHQVRPSTKGTPSCAQAVSTAVSGGQR